jgi:PTH1 family peptidyl-tRNA hydrolase
MNEKFQGSFQNDRYADISEIKIKNKKVYLIKPTTYMNLSGKAYKYWLDKLAIVPESSMVLVDDLALKFGQMRIKTNGSSGGHNGLTDIELTLQSKNYPRLRFGIGNEFSKGYQVDFVLGKWNEEEQKILSSRIDLAVEATTECILAGFANGMNKYNNL